MLQRNTFHTAGTLLHRSTSTCNSSHGHVLLQNGGRYSAALSMSRRFLVFPSAAATQKPKHRQEVGSSPSLDWRVFFHRSNRIASFWHDVPLVADRDAGLYNFIAEIPRGTRAKNEIATDEEHTPIKQDTSNGELRFFRYGPIPFNYGCLPQTYEDPHEVHKDTKRPGDNDPLDVCEISDSPLEPGLVEPVKVLGLFGLIDNEETDWKIIALSKSHALAGKINDITDVEQHMPGKLDSIRDWFRNYKVPDGKPPNRFSHNDKAQPKAYALQIIDETNRSWRNLITGKINKGSLYTSKSAMGLE